MSNCTLSFISSCLPLTIYGLPDLVSIMYLT